MVLALITLYMITTVLFLFSVDRQSLILIERMFVFPGVKNAADGGTLCLFLKGNLMSKPHFIFASFPIQNS